MKLTYRPEVDGLRAIAVTSVILFHVWPDVFVGGFLGVDVFLVISGYLITKIIYNETEKGEFSFSNFYMRRIKRILPAQLVVILVCLLVFPLLLLPSEIGDLGKSGLYSAFTAANIYFWLESGYFGALSSHSVLLHMWSLGVEEQYYMFWPIILTLLMSFRSPKIVVAGTLILLAGSVVAAQYFWGSHPSAVFYLTPFRAFEFLVGGFLSYHLFPHPGKILGDVIAFLGLIALGASLFLFRDTYPHPGFLTLIPVLATAAIIFGTQSGGLMKTVLGGKLPVHVGLLSYSLYLVHWPLIVGSRLIYSDNIDLASGLALISMVYIASLILHHLWEKPLRYGKLGSIPIPAGAWASFGVFAATTFVAANVWGLHPKGISSADAAEDMTAKNVVEGTCESPVTPVQLANCSTQMLVIGDSHAGHATVLMHKTMGPEEIITRMSLPGCPALFGVWKIFDGKNLRAEEKACKELIAEWEPVIIKSDAKVVVLATRWAWLTEPGNYGNVDLREEALVTKESDPQTHEYSRTVLRSAMQRTIDDIVKSGKKVIIIGQVPLLTREVEKCAQNAARSKQSGRNCTIPRAFAEKRMEFHRKLFSELADKNKDVIFVDLFNVLCGN